MIVVLAVSVIYAPQAAAHGGRTAADACHNDRKNGGRHCHGVAPIPLRPATATGTRAYHPNCATANAAGLTPIYRGQPGYGHQFDRDGDGKASELLGLGPIKCSCAGKKKAPPVSRQGFLL